MRVQANGVAPLVVAEDGFGSLFPHETVGDCLQIRGQDFTLPALLLRRLSSRLGIVEERGDLDLFPHPLARDQ